MGMLLHPGGGARARRRVVRPVSDINVTPLIDVMLVLLVVFMVTAPMMTVGVPVDLPKAGAPPLQGQDEPLVVTVNARHEIFIQETRVTEEEMVPRLVAIARQNRDLRIFVRGDQTLPYGEMMRIMGCLYSGGFLKVALVTHGQSQPAGKRPGT